MEVYDASARYEKVDRKAVGEGTYGVIYKGKDKETGRIVAIKKMRSLHGSSTFLDVSSLREMKSLQELKHPNIVSQIDSYYHKSRLYIIYEYLDTDLEKVIRDKSILLDHVSFRSYMWQLLSGLAYIHRHQYMHRDLKPSNLLLDCDGRLKIADMGLCRNFGDIVHKLPQYTPEVCTRWYRAPELLFGAKQYGCAIDMWAVGCIFAELLQRAPLFPGESDVEQLQYISKHIGSIDPSSWPGVSGLPNYININVEPSSVAPLEDIPGIKHYGPLAVDLLKRLLTLDPRKRISAEAALSHPYMRTGVSLSLVSLPHVPNVSIALDRMVIDSAKKRSEDDDENTERASVKRTASRDLDRDGQRSTRRLLFADD